MVFIGYLLVTTLGVSNMVNAAPLSIGRRSTTDATQAWLQKCLASGEGERCIEVTNKASKALLATAGVCDQQNVADEMIDLAKSLHHNSAELITLAQEYAHASHATSGSCTTAPKHSELASTSKSSKTVAAKVKTGHSKTSKTMHKSISAKEDGEEEEEGTPEGEEGQTNQLPGVNNTPTTQTPNNSTNTTAPTTQPTTTTPINIVVNSANPPPTDPNNNGTQVPPHTANMSPQANYTSQVLSINQALAAATQSLSSAGNSLASALGVIAQAINNINSATQSLLPGLNITTTTPPIVANLALNNSTNSTVPCPDPNNPGTKNSTTTDGNTPPADTGNGSTPPPEGQQDQSQSKGNQANQGNSNAPVNDTQASPSTSASATTTSSSHPTKSTSNSPPNDDASQQQPPGGDHSEGQSQSSQNANPNDPQHPAQHHQESHRREQQQPANGDQSKGHQPSQSANPNDPNPPAQTHQDAQQQQQQQSPSSNTQHGTPRAEDPCAHGEQACINDGFAQCVWGKWQVTPCASGTKCFALGQGTPSATFICTTPEDGESRLRTS